MKEKTAFFQNAGKASATRIFSPQSSGTRNSCFASTSDAARRRCDLFANKLALCCSDSVRPHVSTDGYNPYHVAIPAAFGFNVDHGMLIKQFASPSRRASNGTAQRR